MRPTLFSRVILMIGLNLIMINIFIKLIIKTINIVISMCRVRSFLVILKLKYFLLMELVLNFNFLHFLLIKLFILLILEI